MPHSVTNEVVADQLLRAKVRGRGDVRAPSSVNSGGVMVPERAPCAAQPTNPGVDKEQPGIGFLVLDP